MKNLGKIYNTGSVRFEALKDINLTIDKGEYISIVGPSGSGKSTMMNIIGCLDVPSSGEYYLDDQPVDKMTSNELADIRNTKVGFVFQAFNLLPYATAYENIEVPLLFAKVSGKQRKERIIELLSRVGLADKVNNRPTEMSGGEMQRVAIARSLANNPDIILADEPTGNLDSKSGGEIIKIFDELNSLGKTVMIITHDMSIADKTRRIIRLKDGFVEANNLHAA
jgi:putative ABC transport system ATP-binding protein